MRVSVRLFTTLRELAGKGEEAFEFDAKTVTVSEILERMVRRYGEDFKNHLYDERGNVREHLQLLVNGRSVNFLEDLETKLKDGDHLAIVPPVGGG